MTWTSEIWSEVKEVRWHKRKWRCESAVKQITGRADCDSMWENMVYIKPWSYRAAAVPADIPRRQPARDVLQKETRSMKDAFCFLFVRLLLIIICNTQVGLQLLSWAPWNDFTERVFPLAVFYCWISQPSRCTKTSSHLRCRVHQEEFFGVKRDVRDVIP